MYSTCYRWKFVLFALICCFLATGTSSKLMAQRMASVVNSTADDDDAYPFDDPDTEDIDESMDGICGDAQGRCTLRAALDEADNIGAAADVTFSIDGIITLKPFSSLMPPDGSVINATGRTVAIQGSTFFAFLMFLQNNTTVRGLRFGAAADAIDVLGAGNIIGGGTHAEGNVFLGMTQNAINLIGDNNLVIGNFIGLIPDNSGTAGNQFGVFVVGSNNTIGGTLPGQSNIISGNTVAGIAIATDTTGGAGGGNKIVGNYIGTDLYGTQKMPNQYGIEVLVGHDVTIGGPSPAERNIISGNSASGIEVGIEARDVTIRGNYIGMDVSGTANLGNRDGVTLGPGSNHCIVEKNLIRGNTAIGVLISGATGILASTHNRLSGNKILHNQGHGVLLVGNATDNVIGSSLTQNYDSNQVQFNGTGGSLSQGGGVYILENSQGAPKENTIRKNAFLDNVPFGISLDVSGSVQDNIVPPTIITYEDAGAGNVSVTGRHDRPGSLIDVYTGEKNASTTFQGRRWLGADYVDLDSTFNVPIGAACGCEYLVATATDILGNTSEFSLSPFLVRNTTITAQLSLNSGWNMVSVPVVVADFQTTALFPAATSNAYSYQGGSYMVQTTLTNGIGYWVQYGEAASTSMTGSSRTSDTISLTTGWNLIGSISDPVPVSQIASIPGGMVTSQFFGYTSSYEIADTIQPGKAYWVRVSGNGSLILSSLDSVAPASPINIVPETGLPPPPPAGVSSVDGNGQPAKFVLGDAYPNPFNPSTTIEFGIVKPGFVSLKTYDVLGREVATLVNEQLQPGTYRRTWNAGNMPSGVYYYRLVAGSFVDTKKVILLR